MRRKNESLRQTEQGFVNPLLLRGHILRTQSTECFVVSLIPSLTRSSHDPFLFRFTLAARLDRNTQGEPRDAETLGTATELTGIICCITRMIITERRLLLLNSGGCS